MLNNKDNRNNVFNIDNIYLYILIDILNNIDNGSNIFDVYEIIFYILNIYFL